MYGATTTAGITDSGTIAAANVTASGTLGVAGVSTLTGNTTVGGTLCRRYSEHTTGTIAAAVTASGRVLLEFNLSNTQWWHAWCLDGGISDK